jgi:hypothetical protein
MTIGYVGGQLTLNGIHPNDKKITSDSTGVSKRGVQDYNESANLTMPKSKKEQFYRFVNEFYFDSTFQVSRITFPLEVSTPINHYDEDTTRLTMHDWKFVKRDNLLIVYDDFGCTNCDCDSDNVMVTESGLFNSIFYQFARIEDKWFLVNVHENAELGYEKFR